MSAITRLRQFRQALPLALRLLPRELKARLTGAPDRATAVLDYAERNARAGDPESVLAAMDEFARTRQFLMNVGDEKGLLLDRVVSDSQARRVLELGCFCGYSAIRIARLLGEGGRLVSVEKNPHYAEVAGRMLRLAGVESRVEIRVGASDVVIPELTGPFDVVFIDHWKSLYKADLIRLEQAGLLRKGTAIVADNVGPLFGADEYLGYVRGSGRYKTEYHRAHIEYSDLEDGVEISVFQG